MNPRRFIFTVTTGRSGTAYLASLLNLCRNTVGVHEPFPSFVRCMRAVQSNQELARKFLADEKIPTIFKMYRGSPIYAETSHLFCKGFLEAWLEFGSIPTPDLILLDRDLRKVALSMFSLRTIPGKNKSGLRWYLSPTDPTCLTTVYKWQELDDYQLCYWYGLEIEARKRQYAETIVQNGGKIAHTSIADLKKPGGLSRLRRELDLPNMSLTNYIRFCVQKYRYANRGPRKEKKYPLSFLRNLDASEEIVRQRMNSATQ